MDHPVGIVVAEVFVKEFGVIAEQFNPNFPNPVKPMSLLDEYRIAKDFVAIGLLRPYIRF